MGSEEASEEQQRIYDTICPVCNKRYGDHDDGDMYVCFPSLVAMALVAMASER